MNPAEILDKNGVLIKVGMRVLDPLDREQGTVTKIGRLDDEDEGRPGSDDPYIHVSYDDGTEDQWLAHWSATGPDDMDSPYVCDDVVVKADDEEIRPEIGGGAQG